MKLLVLLLAITAYVNAQTSCGQTPVTPNEEHMFIVGGTTAIPYSWPWQVVFCRKSGSSCSLMCGGSVISNQWIMTAGHCVYGYTSNPSNFQVKMGVFNENNNNEAGELISNIQQIILHPQYNSKTTAYDIALLKLSSPITYTSHIQPVCLPANDTGALAANQMVTVTGWGTTSSGGSISQQLRQVSVPIVPISTCNSAKEYGGEVQSNVMFCAGVKGKDSCQGDSGGPLVQKQSNGRWYQYGIVSWGEGCASANYPGVYSRVTAYCSFIKQYTGVSCQ